MCMFERVLVLELKKVHVGISIFNQRGKCMVQMEAAKPQGRIQRLNLVGNFYYYLRI